MPLVRSIEQLADGFRIVTTNKGTIVFTSNDLTAQQKLMTPAQLEAVVQTFLAPRIPDGEFVGVHLTNVVPLLGAVAISNDPLLPNWWSAT